VAEEEEEAFAEEAVVGTDTEEPFWEALCWEELWHPLTITEEVTDTLTDTGTVTIPGTPWGIPGTLTLTGSKIERRKNPRAPNTEPEANRRKRFRTSWGGEAEEGVGDTEELSWEARL
jgi:hypothetical protein